MISRFFISRPIFASVLSIVITLAGGIAVFTLPIAMYPQIAPPTVQVDCTYPGASAQVVSETVATPIEQMVNGVENMLYMSSQCTNDGAYNLTVTFKHGVDLNMAQVLVQNRVSLAVPLLPDVIKQTGVTTRKKSPDILLALAIVSAPKTKIVDGKEVKVLDAQGNTVPIYDQLYLSNYAVMKIKDEIARLPGVSDMGVLGQRDYSMRIWVDPEKLAARSMTASDVADAIRRQNMQVATGQIGQPPVADGQSIQVPLSTLGRLIEPEQFGNMIIKTTAEGHIVRIKDVAQVVMGSKNEDISCSVNQKPAVTLAIFQLPDANALECADTIKAKIEELKKDFPPGLDYEIRYDTTPFIRESIGEVFNTLREAIILVAMVVLLFLQNWRSALIPLVAVPVAIVGTFAVLAVMGFSLNNLTLFGLVLAIGIVVDDAIVVVEAVEHHVEHGMTPRAATERAMDEVSGPVIAIGLVLTAVFVPCAFITGIVGQFFRQFALTIATSTVISAFNSLTLSPALAALLIRPKSEQKQVALPRLAYSLIAAIAAYGILPELLATAAEQVQHRWPSFGERAHLESLIRFLAGKGVPTWAPGLACAAAAALIFWPLGYFLDRVLVGIFKLFNSAFGAATKGYSRLVALSLKGSVAALLIYGGLLYLTYDKFQKTPAGFIPVQDMGYVLCNVQLPDSTSLERTKQVLDKCEAIAKATPGIRFTQAITGQSLLLSANGSNFGSMFCILDEFDKRRPPSLFARIKGWATGVPVENKLYSEAIINELKRRFGLYVPEAMLTVLGPPPVRGVGRAGGFKILVEDRGDLKSQMLQAQADKLVAKARTFHMGDDPKADVVNAALQKAAPKPGGTAGGPPAASEKPLALTSLISTFRANVPQFYVDVNRGECMTKEVKLQDLFDTLRIYLGSLYVNDFNRFGRTWQVVVQADRRFRNDIGYVHRLQVRNARGTMVPVGALAAMREQNGPLVLTRYNTYPAAPINGAAAPGISSGEAIAAMQALGEGQLLPSMSTEWTELAFLELQAGNTAMIVFGVAVVMVFLVLAAQYESWSMPLAILLVVPMCLLSAIIGVNIAGEDVNIFTQIGFVVLVGLASKNAILIVEFAKQRRDAGETRWQATMDACTLRLRPIIMTSFAFILGVLPLLTGHGAGAEMRRTLGITVFSGMLGVTLFGIFLTPVFYFVIDWIGQTRFFTHPLVRKIGGVPLAVLSMRWLARPAMRMLSKGARGKPAVVTEIEGDSGSDHELVVTGEHDSEREDELVKQK